MVIFFEEGVVFHCSLLKLQINAATVDTNYTPDSAIVEGVDRGGREGERML